MKNFVSDLVTNDENPKKLYSFINCKRCVSSEVHVLKTTVLALVTQRLKLRS
ncbi:hypothetical protein DPMN_158426 [Dreissena polymorpha]|uniref:Uncharacterized protein n=1 Tax=Dreissena polymorpha TaxID=45954 RepID=A0A9D4EJ49_DREPO|nr:hypothetical protein DPMN_158426 [Dreissena polymorpha]